MEPDSMNHADINFYFDPLCPFAWMTSKWARQVTAQRDYSRLMTGPKNAVPRGGPDDSACSQRVRGLHI